MKCVSRSALLLLSCLAASAQPTADLVQASKSPYDLARFIDSHTGFDWNPLWKTLGIGDSDARYLFPCENRGSCTTELIVFLDPDQTILHIHDGAVWDTYLRYLGTPNSGWRFSGAFTPMFRYFPQRHETARVGNKPFLKISTQGVNGSDWGSEIEKWFDLTQPDFAPVFSFSPQGWGLDYLGGPPVIRVNHSYHTYAYVDSNDPGETINLSIDISFKAGDDTSEYDLGSATYVGVYKRNQGQKKFSLRTAYPILDSHTPIPIPRFEALDGGIEFKNEEVLFYILTPLKRIASSSDTPAKRWLRKLLVTCKDTPEKRAIQAAFR
jgi:hypothetical protein